MGILVVTLNALRGPLDAGFGAQEFRAGVAMRSGKRTAEGVRATGLRAQGLKLIWA